MKEIGVNYSHHYCWVAVAGTFVSISRAVRFDVGHVTAAFTRWTNYGGSSQVIWDNFGENYSQIATTTLNEWLWFKPVLCLFTCGHHEYPFHLIIILNEFLPFILFNWICLNEITCTYHCLLDLVVDCNCTSSRSAEMEKKRQKWKHVNWNHCEVLLASD